MMRVGATTAIQQPYTQYTVCAAPRSSSVSSRASRDHPSNLKLFSSGLHSLPRISFRCNCAGDSGENESKTILDAFFLGKAVAEALNERVESAVGEFLSTIGRLQAEQQKQVQEFQEEVLEKARRAKEQAAMEAQGLVPKSTVVDKTSSVNVVAVNASSDSDSVTVAESSVNASSVSDSATFAESSFESKPTTEDLPNED